MMTNYVFGEYRFLVDFFMLNLEKNLEGIEVVSYKIEGLKFSVFFSCYLPSISKRIQGQKELGNSGINR